MLLYVVCFSSTRTERSATVTTAAAKSPPRQCQCTAHASTAPITQNPGNVACTLGTLTKGVTRIAPTLTARSATRRLGRRRRGSSYAQMVKPVHAVIAASASTAASGRSKLVRQRYALSPSMFNRTSTRRIARARNMLSSTVHGDRASVSRAVRLVIGGVRSGRLELGLVGGWPGDVTRALTVEPLLLLLRPAGVHVDVLLTGEPHDLVHDLVGDRPEDEPVVLQTLVAREVQGLPEPHERAGHLAELLAGRGHHVRPDDGDRDHRHLHLEGESCHAGLASIQPAVVRTGALGINPEQTALAQDPFRRRESALGGRGAGAVDRDLAGTGEELLLEPALDAGRREVLSLRHERHATGKGQRHEEPVGVRQVVARENGRTLGGDVLCALGPWAEDELQDRADQHPLEQPVKQSRTSSTACPLRSATAAVDTAKP